MTLAIWKSGLEPSRAGPGFYFRREESDTKEKIKMGSWVGRFAPCAFAILLCGSLSAGADLKSAKRAYEQKDYATALKEISPLAEQGNAEAQFILGKMYWRGEGVLKDPDQGIKWFKASAAQGNADAEFFVGAYYLLPHTDIAQGLKWLRLSAEQGNQDAQLLLGKTYMDGNQEVRRDPVLAEMWLRLAAKNNLEFYQKELLGAERQMTADQIAKGKELAAAWKPKHGPQSEEKARP